MFDESVVVLEETILKCGYSRQIHEVAIINVVINKLGITELEGSTNCESITAWACVEVEIPDRWRILHHIRELFHCTRLRNIPIGD